MKYPEITLTCTTSNRYKLYQTMMLSLYFNCQDMDLISNNICVDDRSSKYDFELMQKMFPTTTYIRNLKGGQLYSIKLLLENVKTEWILHTEDDWIFIKQDNFIKKMFDIINIDDRIKNVTLRFWDCIYIKQDDIEYRMHVYSPMNYKTEWDIIKMNDNTYAGLSLNPGLIHVPTLKKCVKDLTQNDVKDKTWDRKMSKNYWNMGYRRANLIDNYVEHTGECNSCYKKGN